jgi:hypothetical protein
VFSVALSNQPVSQYGDRCTWVIYSKLIEHKSAQCGGVIDRPF